MYAMSNYLRRGDVVADVLPLWRPHPLIWVFQKLDTWKAAPRDRYAVTHDSQGDDDDFDGGATRLVLRGR